MERSRAEHVVRQPDGEEHEALLETHDAAEQRADDGEVVGRVGHPRQPPLPAGDPLPVDLELPAHDGRWRREHILEPARRRGCQD